VVSGLTVIDVDQLYESVSELLLVDEMDDELLEAPQVFCKLDTLVNLTMRLQHLEDGVLVDVLLVTLHEVAEVQLQVFQLLGNDLALEVVSLGA